LVFRRARARRRFRRWRRAVALASASPAFHTNRSCWSWPVASGSSRSLIFVWSGALERENASGNHLGPGSLSPWQARGSLPRRRWWPVARGWESRLCPSGEAAIRQHRRRAVQAVLGGQPGCQLPKLLRDSAAGPLLPPPRHESIPRPRQLRRNIAPSSTAHRRPPTRVRRPR